MNKQNEELADKLLQITLNDMIRKIESGEATAADVSNAIKFLKDNKITVDGKKAPQVQRLAGKVLPFAKEA